ncbi:hypothetical protein TSAR_013538, partial [Trichomalopsis sarcophagae]
IQNDELSKLGKDKVGLKRLEKKRVCSNHFLESDFVHTSSRRMLKPDIVPQSNLSNSFVCTNSPVEQTAIDFNPVINQNNSDVLNSAIVAEQIDNDDVPLVSSANNILPINQAVNQQSIVKRKSKKRVETKSIASKRLKLRNAKLIRESKSLKQKLLRVTKRQQQGKFKWPEKQLIDKAFEYLNDSVTSIFKVQLNHDKQRKWVEDEKQFALGLYYKSPKPHKYLTTLKDKLYRHCIREHCEREPLMAKSVLVFLVVGLTYGWKQPLMYFPTSGPVSGDKLQKIISDVLLNGIIDCLNAQSLNDSNSLKRGLSNQNPQLEKC